MSKSVSSLPAAPLRWFRPRSATSAALFALALAAGHAASAWAAEVRLDTLRLPAGFPVDDFAGAIYRVSYAP